MHRLNIQKTVSTPSIQFDSNSNRLVIQGESYPENSFEFYTPITSAIKEYLFHEKELKLEINLSYMNSSTTKCILDLLDLLEEAHQNGSKIAITWRYDIENPRSLDLAEEFKEDITFPFYIVVEELC